MLEIRSRAAFCVKPQPPRLCRARGWMQSWDTTGGEVAVFIHCSLSRAQGISVLCAGKAWLRHGCGSRWQIDQEAESDWQEQEHISPVKSYV